MAPRLATLESLLAGSSKQGRGSEYFQNNSPFYRVGDYITEMSYRTPPQTNTQAIALPIIKGLLGGTLMNIGKNQAADTAYDYYKKQPGLSSLYKSETRPEGWDADQGQLDQLLAISQAEEAKKAALEEQKKREEMEKFLRGKSLMMTPDGKVVPDPELVEANLEIFRGEQKAKGDLNPDSAKQALGFDAKMTGEIADTRSIISSTEDLIKKIDVLKPTWAQINAGKVFAGLDKTGTARDIRNLSEMVKTNVTGAAYQKDQGENLDRMVAGDPTMTVEEVRDTLKYFADFQKRRVNSKMDTASKIAAGTLQPYEVGSIGVRAPIDQSLKPGQILKRNKITGETKVVNDG